MEPGVIKKTDQGSVYFTIYWSRLTKADKYDIIKIVPSMPGIFELYYQDRKKKLNLFFLARAYYGGLRNTIRKRTDPELEDDPARRKILTAHDCYYRYTILQSYKDMSDILYFFKQTYNPGDTSTEPSGRYKHIFLEECSDDKIVTI
jgi:hypothetical protein